VRATKKRFTLTDSRSRSISSNTCGPNDCGATSATQILRHAPLCSAVSTSGRCRKRRDALFGDGGNVYSRPGLIGLRELPVRAVSVSGSKTSRRDYRFDGRLFAEGVKVWFVSTMRSENSIVRSSGCGCQALAVIAQQYRPDDPIQKVPELGPAQNADVQSINGSTILYTLAKYQTPPRHQAWPSILLGEFRLQLVHKSSAATTEDSRRGAVMVARSRRLLSSLRRPKGHPVFA